MRKDFLLAIVALILAWAFPLWCWHTVEQYTRNSLNRPRVVLKARECSNVQTSTRLNL